MIIFGKIRIFLLTFLMFASLNSMAEVNHQVLNENKNKENNNITNVLIIGANGRTSAQIIPRLLNLKNVHLRLFLRDSERLNKLKSNRVELFEGDASNINDLNRAMDGQNIVISTMGGRDLDKKTENITKAMTNRKIDRLIVISAGGIWDELPEPFNTWDKVMVGADRIVNRKTAEVVESSNLNYTILRPVWLNDKDIENYTLTYKGEKYKGKSTSRASIANLITKIVSDPTLFSRRDIGISQVEKE